MVSRVSSSEQLPQRVALITGANSGVGYGIALRLLETNGTWPVTVVLGCRNVDKANDARRKLIEKYPGTDVEVLNVDVSSVKSVIDACDEFKRRFTRLDLFFCNAGVLLNKGLSVTGVVRTLFTNPVAFFTDSGETLIQPKGVLTDDGIGAVFAANVFGHYLMILMLERRLSTYSDGRIIWTSSYTAKPQYFSLDDYQHLEGTRPYESSKYAIDILSVALSKRLSPRGITSYAISPGTLHTNIVSGLGLLELAMTPTFYLARALGIPQITITGYAATKAHMHCAFAPLSELDPELKYHSEASRLGYPLMTTSKISPRNGEMMELERRLREHAHTLDNVEW